MIALFAIPILIWILLLFVAFVHVRTAMRSIHASTKISWLIIPQNKGVKHGLMSLTMVIVFSILLYVIITTFCIGDFINSGLRCSPFSDSLGRWMAVGVLSIYSGMLFGAPVFVVLLVFFEVRTRIPNTSPSSDIAAPKISDLTTSEC